MGLCSLQCCLKGIKIPELRLLPSNAKGKMNIIKPTNTSGFCNKAVLLLSAACKYFTPNGQQRRFQFESFIHSSIHATASCLLFRGPPIQLMSILMKCFVCSLMSTFKKKKISKCNENLCKNSNYRGTFTGQIFPKT